MITSNLALVQVQGIVVGFVASIVAVLMDALKGGDLDLDHTLLLCASSIVTASIASFALGLVMVGVIVLSRRCQVNPDNVATPIAASLGDLITLSMLASISSFLFSFSQAENRWVASLIIVAYVFVTPICIYYAKGNAATEQVLYTGWTPVLVAMSISSLGGLILDSAVNKFNGIAVFQPVFNGVGGNLVAVQASRISTYLHTNVIQHKGVKSSTLILLNFTPRCDLPAHFLNLHFDLTCRLIFLIFILISRQRLEICQSTKTKSAWIPCL